MLKKLVAGLIVAVFFLIGLTSIFTTIRIRADHLKDWSRVQEAKCFQMYGKSVHTPLPSGDQKFVCFSYTGDKQLFVEIWKKESAQ